MPEEAIDELAAQVAVDDGEYVPNTTAPNVRGGHRDGQAVVSGPYGSRKAPECLVIFECPSCSTVTRADAYRGVVSCGTCEARPFMTPKALA